MDKNINEMNLEELKKIRKFVNLEGLEKRDTDKRPADKIVVNHDNPEVTGPTIIEEIEKETHKRR